MITGLRPIDRIPELLQKNHRDSFITQILQNVTRQFNSRYHNIFGPEGTWSGGKEKAPAAICRKVAEAEVGSNIEIWGPGTQTRSFLYIDECIEGTIRLLRSDKIGPFNIGSNEMITINDLAKMVSDISNKKLNIINIDGPVGVMGRNSDNTLIQSELGWSPDQPLRTGMLATYQWIAAQINI